ncbi:type I-C CRISPR-associated protein Cas5c [Peptoniphilus equinus]|uniref:pre-crRNA processing endonuclease n=1 Tax=Peptoniphilus equinus TaxID=3016343 RepID=A0ABY7QT02_9FIRM|nr:type I-C CRISPR-associated protein Cas5c [Peptoniphilus equinus]WBW49927.1 type I-C CRISPR-associated protein Cas5c [Peptoniphilus equinus]
MHVIIEGDYGCFTRPEMKVERVSYDVPTPGALEGLLKAVYWKPSMRYVIDKIVVMNPIQFINVRRNEVKNKISLQKVKRQMKDPKVDISLYTREGDEISQRAAMVLKNVKYGVSFHIELTGICDEQERHLDGVGKHLAILERRLKGGQYFKTPCLGCSEFPVKVIRWVESIDEDLVCDELRHQECVDLGFMLYRMDFEDGGRPKQDDWGRREFSDRAKPVFYRPQMKRGIIDVATYREECRC